MSANTKKMRQEERPIKACNGYGKDILQKPSTGKIFTAEYDKKIPGAHKTWAKFVQMVLCELGIGQRDVKMLLGVEEGWYKKAINGLNLDPAYRRKFEENISVKWDEFRKIRPELGPLVWESYVENPPWKNLSATNIQAEVVFDTVNEDSILNQIRKGLMEISSREFRDGTTIGELCGKWREKENAVRLLSLLFENDEEIAKHLKALVSSRSYFAPLESCIKALGRGWKTASETRGWLQNQATESEDEFVRAAALRELARYWPEPATLEFLKKQSVEDTYSDVRQEAVRSIAHNWKGNLAILKWLKHLVVTNCKWGVAAAAVEGIVRNFNFEAGVESWLKETARHHEDEVVRAIAGGKVADLEAFILTLQESEKVDWKQVDKYYYGPCVEPEDMRIALQNSGFSPGFWDAWHSE